VIAKLTGPKREQLSGEVISEVGGPLQLKGRMPSDESCYVIIKIAADRLVLVSWLPEGTPPRVKMSVSTFKKSVLQLLQGKFSQGSVGAAEITAEDELTEDMGKKRSEEDLAKEKAEEERAAAAAGQAPEKKGFRPPVGGFALPGMGRP
jgi:hypothetical protein